MMAMSRLISALLIAAALGSFDVPVALAGPGTTAADGWQVLESHGGVRYRPVSERHWWPARTGIEIPTGSIVATGSSGFLIIARAGESITLQTNSRLELQGGPNGEQVQQEAGNARYRITRAPDRRFAVETPYLSLMVKGTVFDVGVSDQGAEVEVTQGRVRVDTPRGQTAELSPGQGARIAERADAGLELRAGPESPFAAAPPPGGSIAAAYLRDDGDSGTADRRHDTADQGAGQVPVDTPRGQVTARIARQSAPAATSAGSRLALRTAPEGPIEAAPAPSRPTAMATRDDGISSTDRPRRDAASQAVGRSDQASPGDLDGSGARGAGIEITADGVGVDGPGPQVAAVDPSQIPPVAGSAGVDPEPGPGRESVVAVVPRPRQSIAAAEAVADGSSPRRDAPDQASDRPDQASSGGGTGDRVAVGLLVLVLLAALVWWWRQRQTTVGSTDRGRWPWQRQRVDASPGAPSNAPSSTSMRDGTRRSTTYARL